MKLIVLIDGTSKNIDELMDGIDDPDEVLFFDTHTCASEAVEYESLSTSASVFANMKTEIMVVRFSGNNYVANTLGDELSEMVITLSYNETSLYYADDLVATFLNTIDLFKKGD